MTNNTPARELDTYYAELQALTIDDIQPSEAEQSAADALYERQQRYEGELDDLGRPIPTVNATSERRADGAFAARYPGRDAVTGEAFTAGTLVTRNPGGSGYVIATPDDSN